MSTAQAERAWKILQEQEEWLDAHYKRLLPKHVYDMRRTDPNEVQRIIQQMGIWLKTIPNSLHIELWKGDEFIGSFQGGAEKNGKPF